MTDAPETPFLGRSKRRKISPPGNLNLTDIPDTILADVGSYLPKPSRALFAVAVTAPSSLWRGSNWDQHLLPPSRAAKVILSSQSDWDVLDFGEIENNLALKLGDRDVKDVLVCIDAANNLKCLKLAGCVNITGQGLEPLRGSVVLEQADLSLVKMHESPTINPDPLLSEDTVLPILSSIVDTHGNNVKHLYLPKK